MSSSFPSKILLNLQKSQVGPLASQLRDWFNSLSLSLSLSLSQVSLEQAELLSLHRLIQAKVYCSTLSAFLVIFNSAELCKLNMNLLLNAATPPDPWPFPPPYPWAPVLAIRIQVLAAPHCTVTFILSFCWNIFYRFCLCLGLKRSHCYTLPLRRPLTFRHDPRLCIVPEWRPRFGTVRWLNICCLSYSQTNILNVYRSGDPTQKRLCWFFFISLNARWIWKLAKKYWRNKLPTPSSTNGLFLCLDTNKALNDD